MSISISRTEISVSGLAWFKQAITQRLPETVLTDEQFLALHNHFELLCRWNQRMDLTSVDTPEEIVSRHYCESLFFAARIPESRNVSVLDFGSGAGFPGLPLAVLRPSWRVTLLEANSRRAVFLKEAARGVSNIRVVTQRGEDFPEKHDWVVARAVRARDVLRCMPQLGSNVGLLAGEASIKSLLDEHGFVWAEPVRIPGSSARCCIFGQCST